jgi:hypothetical protein
MYSVCVKARLNNAHYDANNLTLESLLYVASTQRNDALWNSVGFPGRQEQVHVVGHQDGCVKNARVLDQGLFQPMQIADVPMSSGHAADHSSYPRSHDGDRRKSDGPCRDAAFEPLSEKLGVDSLRGYKDEGRYDADHDGREQRTEEDRCKTSGNTHFILLCVVTKRDKAVT